MVGLKFKIEIMNLYTDFLTVNGIDVNNPEFDKKGKVHDWRNYVFEDWVENWNEFTERERQIIAVMCQTQADIEEWD